MCLNSLAFHYKNGYHIIIFYWYITKIYHHKLQRITQYGYDLKYGQSSSQMTSFHIFYASFNIFLNLSKGIFFLSDFFYKINSQLTIKRLISIVKNLYFVDFAISNAAKLVL
jgi:hypothetical protein